MSGLVTGVDLPQTGCLFWWLTSSIKAPMGTHSTDTNQRKSLNLILCWNTNWRVLREGPPYLLH